MLSIGLTLAFFAAQIVLLLGGGQGWVFWIVPALAIVTWAVLGRFWLNRDLADAQMDADLRDLLDGSK